MASLRHTSAMKCYQAIKCSKKSNESMTYDDAYHIEHGLTKPVSMSISDLSGSLRHRCSFEVLEILIASTPQPSRSQLYLLCKHVLNMFVCECLYQDYILRHVSLPLPWRHWFDLESFPSEGLEAAATICGAAGLWFRWQVSHQPNLPALHISSKLHIFWIWHKFYISLGNVASIAYCTSTI